MICVRNVRRFLPEHRVFHLHNGSYESVCFPVRLCCAKVAHCVVRQAEEALPDVTDGDDESVVNPNAVIPSNVWHASAGIPLSARIVQYE